MRTSTEVIAKEGWKSIFIVGLLFVLMLLFELKLLGFLFFCCCLCLMYFYRNSERIPNDVSSDSILSPLDGVIQKIQTQEDGICIEIKKPICFCGLLRMPILKNKGRKKISLHQEVIKGLKNAHYLTGERTKVIFSLDKNLEFQLVLYPMLFKQVVLYPLDSQFRLGERFGFFLSGKALFRIPLDSELKVGVGDRIYAGETLLAKMLLKNI